MNQTREQRKKAEDKREKIHGVKHACDSLLKLLSDHASLNTNNFRVEERLI